MKTVYQLLGLILLLSACQQTPKVEFNNWYQKKTFLSNSESSIKSALFNSSALAIDTIYRSMQGPFEIKHINISEENEELIWIVGYSSELIKSKSNQKIADAYMCHNNLNYADNNDVPWRLKTTGANSRIFTLSEGQTSLKFPEGFGIPIPANQTLEMVSQVLNHHQKEIDIKVKHQVSLDYIAESQLQKAITPLYQQSVFITKQLSGPAGKYGLSTLCASHHLDSASISGKQPKHDCSVDYSPGKFNPYEDNYGRKFTGHWKLPIGEEILKTDVTQMIDLEEDSKIHMIGVHLHPFAKGLELWDKTMDSLLYKAEINPDSSNFGFSNINYYKSETGIPVFADHNYQLISNYNCTDSSEAHTAMAVMYLYLEDK